MHRAKLTGERCQCMTSHPFQGPLVLAGVGICSSTCSASDTGLWPLSMSLAHGLSLVHSLGCSWELPVLSCGELPSLLPGMKLSIPPGLLVHTSLSGVRCKRLAVSLGGLCITFSVGFAVLPSSLGLWVQGSSYSKCELLLCAACGVKPFSRQKLCCSSGSGK